MIPTKESQFAFWPDCTLETGPLAGVYRHGNCRLLTLPGSLLEPVTHNALPGSQGRCGLHVFFFFPFRAPKQSAQIPATTRTDAVAEQTSSMSQKPLILDEVKKSCVIF